MAESAVARVQTAERSFIPAWRLDRDELMGMAERLHPNFQAAEPFPHVVIPNFLPADIAKAAAAEFPAVQDYAWDFAGPGKVKHTNDPNVEKVSSNKEHLLPPVIRSVLHELNGSTFLDFLIGLSGYEGLLSDPWLGGGGMHSTGRGGRLMIHADSDRHPNDHLFQQINCILYMTPNWQDEWGGHLELWDREAKECVRRVKPEFNTLLVFYTGSKAFHGHPHPLETPAGVRRNSLATYYYTTYRPRGDDYEGRTRQVNWQRTNELDQNVTLKTRTREVLERLIGKR